MNSTKPLKSAAQADLQHKRLLAGREVIAQEANALLVVGEALDEQFSAATEMILSITASGRLVVAGIGKTGFIGMKLSATFASIGIPSYFLHPAEALHGDLGRLSEQDVLVLLSNSGENSEITSIIPFIRRIGCRIIAITARSDSTLGRASDVVIAVGKLREAGPLGLAPTTSALALLAVGDALAMTVLSERPIDRRHFAGVHPGGALGRSLLLVSEVMRSGDEHCVVSQDARCSEVLHQITLTKNRPGAASIVDRDGKLTGVFTDGDLRRCLDACPDFLTRPVREVMGRTPKTIPANVLAEEAMAILSKHRIDQVIVVDDGNRPVGMVDIQDLISG